MALGLPPPSHRRCFPPGQSLPRPLHPLHAHWSWRWQQRCSCTAGSWEEALGGRGAGVLQHLLLGCRAPGQGWRQQGCSLRGWRGAGSAGSPGPGGAWHGHGCGHGSCWWLCPSSVSFPACWSLCMEPGNGVGWEWALVPSWQLSPLAGSKLQGLCWVTSWVRSLQRRLALPAPGQERVAEALLPALVAQICLEPQRGSQHSPQL